MVNATCCGCVQYKKIADLLRIHGNKPDSRYVDESVTNDLNSHETWAFFPYMNP